MNIRTNVLRNAHILINEGGQRNRDYGEPIDNFERIAAGWRVLLGADVTPHQVALCMVWLKMARLCETPTHEDSYVDAAAYAALAAQLVVEQDG
jgi:hypothetical protein